MKKNTSNVLALSILTLATFFSSNGYAQICGTTNTRTGTCASAIGTSNTVGGDQALAVGQGCTVNGDFSASFGLINSANGGTSFSAGQLCHASGASSIALGANNSASNTNAISIGDDNDATGLHAVCLGENNTSSSTNSISVGNDNTSSSTSSVCIGNTNLASQSNAFAIGKHLNANAVNAFVIGAGVGTGSNRLISTTTNSLMVGFNSNIPTLFVGASAGVATTGNVGIGTASPRSKLDVNGKVIIGTKSYTGTGTDSVVMLSVDGAIVAEEVFVTTTNWADYVFGKDYKLATINEVEEYIEENGHLKGIPSAQKIAENGGVSLSHTVVMQQEKIEELYLYIIELNKKVEKLSAGK
jgi:hypothetical protein